jgi:hypothetical protein
MDTMRTEQSTDFDARWAAWVRRGHAHEQRVRRAFVASAAVIATVAAVVYAFFRA